jgi:hypothetical protein
MRSFFEMSGDFPFLGRVIMNGDFLSNSTSGRYLELQLSLDLLRDSC